MPIWKCNGKEKVNNNQKKRIYFKILNLLLVIILVFSVASVGGCSMESKQGAKGAKSAGKRQSEDARFEEYTAELFCKEVSANTVSLHYTLKAPEKYGIEATDATFGQFEREPEAVKAAAENMRQALLGFNYDDLNVQNKITYDILNYRLKLMKKSADYTMYEEPLGLVSGVQTQLPVVLSEYRFYDKEDVEVYLALVRQTEEYFEEIMIFEKKKAEMGLFMPDQAVETVIGQCRAFLEMGNGNYLYSTFADRVMELNTLTEKEKSDYIQENALAISDYVFPAYERMTEELEQLKGSGKNEKGLVYFPKGKEYYELLARQSTGSRRSVEELKDLTRRQINEDLTAMEQVLGLTTKEAKEAAASGPPGRLKISSSPLTGGQDPVKIRTVINFEYNLFWILELRTRRNLSWQRQLWKTKSRFWWAKAGTSSVSAASPATWWAPSTAGTTPSAPRRRTG